MLFLQIPSTVIYRCRSPLPLFTILPVTTVNSSQLASWKRLCISSYDASQYMTAVVGRVPAHASKTHSLFSSFVNRSLRSCKPMLTLPYVCNSTLVATSARWSRSTVGIPWTLLYLRSAFLTLPVRHDILVPSVAPVLPYYGCNGNRNLFLSRMPHNILSQPCMFMFRACSVVSVFPLLLHVVLYSIHSSNLSTPGALAFSAKFPRVHAPWIILR